MANWILSKVLLSSILVAATVAQGNQTASKEFKVKSSLLFSCDDSDLKKEILALRQEVRQAQASGLSCQEQNCQDYQQLREEISMLKNALIPVGSSPFNPASSCREIFSQPGGQLPVTDSYWLSTATGVTKVTCDFKVQLPPSSPVRGWQEIANIDLSKPSSSCPSTLREINTPSRRCEKLSDSARCDSVYFSTNSVPFSKFCGHMVGYAQNSPDAFDANFGICSDSRTCDSIDDPYVDGVSITYSNSSGSREHLWSLSAEFDRNLGFSRCPCANNSQFQSPPFVGDHFYCETFVNETSPIWEGEGCADVHEADAPCCENPNLPWFCREFDQPIVTDTIEVRLCTDESRGNEEIEFDLLQLYIQ